MKDAVVYLLCNCYFAVTLICQIISIPMAFHPAPFFTILFLHSYQRKRMNKLKNNDLIKTKNLCNIFRFIDDLSSINDGRDFESNYCNI